MQGLGPGSRTWPCPHGAIGVSTPPPFLREAGGEAPVCCATTQVPHRRGLPGQPGSPWQDGGTWSPHSPLWGPQGLSPPCPAPVGNSWTRGLTQDKALGRRSGCGCGADSSVSRAPAWPTGAVSHVHLVPGRKLLPMAAWGQGPLGQGSLLVEPKEAEGKHPTPYSCSQAQEAHGHCGWPFRHSVVTHQGSLLRLSWCQSRRELRARV